MVRNSSLEERVEEDMRKAPNILTIDIETSPIIAYAWGPKYETNLIDFIEQGQIICYSGKWLDGKQITKGLPDYTGYKPGIVDDTKIVKDIHAMLDNADIVVAQNGINFDLKYINSRFLAHNLPPPSPYRVVDTKVEAKKYLRLPSYSLDEMGTYFKLGNKMDHEGFDLWKKCMAGDKKAWSIMKKYNAQDVLLTEKVYLKIRPFMKTHPNIAIYSETKDCPKCGSDNVQSRGYAVNNTTKYHRAQCQDCGGWHRYGKSIPLNNKPGVGV